MAKSTDLVLRDFQDETTLVSLEAILRGDQPIAEYTFEERDTSSAQGEILNQILNATDDDELENIGQANGWQNYLGVPMGIWGFRPFPSEKEGEGPPFYLLVNVTNGISGDELTVSIGSWGVIAQLINLAKRGKIPGAVRILVKGEETKAGRNPLRLVSTEREKDERLAAKAKERL